MSKHYQSSVDKVCKSLNSSKNGLSEKKAKHLLKKYGKNDITKKNKIDALKIFLEQFKSFIILILMIALIISLVLGYVNKDPSARVDNFVDAGVIFTILFINSILGFVQEYKAEKSIEALKKLTSLRAQVLRNGKVRWVDATLLVPGDIIILEPGEKVPADARIIESNSLETQEAALTGESFPIQKHNKPIIDAASIGDRKNMVYSGTIITKGKGLAIVTETGMKTEFGKIAKLIEESEPPQTPLQAKLQKLGKWIGSIVLVIVFIVFLAGVLRGASIEEMFVAAIALAVAAVPEGLPAVVTVTLALGVQRMVKKNALVRKLPSVETLGSTTVICSDKTGTLTKNEMTVQKIFVNNKVVEITGTGYDKVGKFSSNPDKFSLLLKAGALCNDAIIDDHLIGDPTEGALIVSAAKAQFDKQKLLRNEPRISEIPFDSERKMMSTIHKLGKERVMYTKGATEKVLQKCDFILNNGYVEKLSEEQKKKIIEQNQNFADQALRVLGFAYRELNHNEVQDEKKLIFLGLQAMIDPPREEAKLAIKRCKKAGIRVIMITGDHKNTAIAIAKQLGIKGEALTGEDIENMNDLESKINKVSIFARVNPEHKTKIVEALQAKGHVVAMTGDGVNDAPALKKAEIGIAMGISGTDVAKEASGMILTDDNFASIVNAVEEGRAIYDNIKKFVFYLISSNIGEILTIFVAILIGFTDPRGLLLSPVLAVHILWINLLTDGLPALALSVDKPDHNIMERKPRPRNEKIMDNHNIVIMISVAIVMMLVTLFMFNLYKPSETPVYAQTIAFTTLVILQMFNVLNATSEKESIFEKGLFENKWLLGAIGTSIALQFVVLYVPTIANLFKVVPINIIDWVYIILASSLVLIFGELVKLISKKHIFKSKK